MIAAARAEFLKKGIHGARIEDITAACDLSKGAFYLHFESKEALFRKLVDSFSEALARCSNERMAAMHAFVAEHGPLEASDFEQRTDRYEQMLSLDTEHDARILEMLWEHRDVMTVLISGCAGTEFDGLVWQMVDQEVQRIAQFFRELQGTGVCRGDIRPEFFGSMIVGTYLLVGKQLIHHSSKPDLREWARSLQRLIHEGSSLKNASFSEQPRPVLPKRRVRKARTRGPFASSKKQPAEPHVTRSRP